MKSTKILYGITLAAIYLTIFLVPLFFLPVTAEILEFNKQFLLYLLVLIGLLSWIGRGIVEKKLVLRRTPLDIPLVVFWVTILVASLVSRDRYLSVWGDYNLLSFGLIPVTFYLLFYFLVLNNIKGVREVRRLLLVFGGSIFAAILYFLNQAFNLFPLGKFILPRWSTVTVLPSHFGYVLVLVLVLSLSFLLQKREKFWIKENIFWTIVSVFFFAGIVMIGFKSVWMIAAMALFLLLVFSVSRAEEITVHWVSISFALLVIAVLATFLGTPQFLTAKLPPEVSLASSVSWRITTAALAEDLKHFLFGSGPATFVYEFSEFRPESFNNNFAWATRFTKPYNEMLNLLGTIGLLGVVTFVAVLLTALGTMFVIWFRRPEQGIGRRVGGKVVELLKGEGDGMATGNRATLFIGVVCVWIILLISTFFITFTTVHWFLFFTILACILIISSGFGREELSTVELSLKLSPQYTLVSSFVYILVFTGVIMLGAYLGRFYAADVVYARSFQSAFKGDFDGSIAELKTAVGLNPRKSSYHLSLARAFIDRGRLETQKEKPNTALITSLIASAVNEAKLGTDLAPQDAGAWEFLATMYSNARILSADANRFAVSALERAVELEPTNPQLHLSLGAAKLMENDNEAARAQFEESVRLKPTFIPGYINLAVLDEQEGDTNRAIEHMAAAAALAPNDPAVVFSLGRFYYNRARNDDLIRAEQLFSRAILLNPDYADALWSLGLLYERQGKSSDALKFYRRVEALNPENESVKAKIRALIAPAE